MLIDGAACDNRDMRSTAKLLWVAAAGTALGLVALTVVGDRHPVWQSDTGQKVLQKGLETAAPEPPPGVTVAKVGDKIPAMSLRTIGGDNQQRRELKEIADGKPMLINFWASWCGPCIREIPELVRYANSDKGKDVTVVGIALDEPAAAQSFVDRFKMNYPQLWDEIGPKDASVTLGNPAGVLPYSVLIGADGMLLKQKIGPFAEGEIDKWVVAAP